jgi:hypothetical protein
VDRTHDPTRTPVTYYYRDGATCVTDTWLVVSGRRYAIAHLRRPRTVRSLGGPTVKGAALTSGVVAVGILLVARHLSTVGWIGAGVALAVPVVVLAGGLARARRPYELWAEYRGLTVQLLCEPDAGRYAKICQALTLACQ